jgi:putative SOS response-associated peptidase YedK
MPVPTQSPRNRLSAPYKSRRGLVLADGYYEWLREGKEKQSYLYEFDGGKPFAFAGLWSAGNRPLPSQSNRAR